jgi:hypothetical protein
MVLSRLFICVSLLASLQLGCRNEKPLINFDPEEAVSTWVSMWNSYDLSLVDELFLTDPTVTYFSSEKEGLIRGIDALRKHHAGFGFVRGGKVQENKLWVEDLHTTTFGSTAVVTGVWYFRRGAENSGTIQRGPVTFVYVQKADEWRIAHVHFAEYE